MALLCCFIRFLRVYYILIIYSYEPEEECETWVIYWMECQKQSIYSYL